MELVYQNHCEAMIATEAQKNEELERLLVAQKSIVVSSRERIRALEGEGRVVYSIFDYITNNFPSVFFLLTHAIVLNA